MALYGQEGHARESTRGRLAHLGTLGLRNIKGPLGIEPDPERAPLIVELFEAAATSTMAMLLLLTILPRLYTYTGMITCTTCNGLLVGDRKKGKYTYYACNKCRTYYPEASFDQHAMHIIKQSLTRRGAQRLPPARTR